MGESSDRWLEAVIAALDPNTQIDVTSDGTSQVEAHLAGDYYEPHVLAVFVGEDHAERAEEFAAHVRSVLAATATNTRG